MLDANVVIAVCLGYVVILFGVAFAGDRRARRDPGGWLASPLVYTLSISIYCTSWTFFGAVGSAARSGIEFATIYLGPTIVFVGWWVFLRKLVTVGRVHHITSIAVSRVVTSETIGVDELRRLAGETEQIRAYSAELEAKSRQIEATVADLARANEQLRAIDSQKDDFLSQVSHELRTPMASIRSFSDILINNRDLPESRRLRFLGIIQNESLRLTRLLDGFLHLDQLEAGGPSWEVALFDPEVALDQALESCEALAERAGVVLKCGARARAACVEGDGDKLAQVLINLISNAIRHNTSPQPEVVVASGIVGGSYEVSVADNGPGVPEGDRERIFAKFTRGGSGRTGGAGLGLAISRQIVERLKGELVLEPGRSGARFTVRLAIAPGATGS